jgi:hypothetical protein
MSWARENAGTKLPKDVSNGFSFMGEQKEGTESELSVGDIDEKFGFSGIT